MVPATSKFKNKVAVHTATSQSGVLLLPLSKINFTFKVWCIIVRLQAKLSLACESLHLGFIIVSRYYLNGNWRIDLKAPKTIAGVRWNYYRHGFLAEKMISIEPLLEDIVVEVPNLHRFSVKLFYLDCLLDKTNAFNR